MHVNPANPAKGGADVTDEPAFGGLLKDGFESGNTSKWAATVP